MDAEEGAPVDLARRRRVGEQQHRFPHQPRPVTHRLHRHCHHHRHHLLRRRFGPSRVEHQKTAALGRRRVIARSCEIARFQKTINRPTSSSRSRSGSKVDARPLLGVQPVSLLLTLRQESTRVEIMRTTTTTTTIATATITTLFVNEQEQDGGRLTAVVVDSSRAVEVFLLFLVLHCRVPLQRQLQPPPSAAELRDAGAADLAGSYTFTTNAKNTSSEWPKKLGSNER